MFRGVYKNNIWDQLIQFSQLSSTNWAEYEKDFEIKKLELEKLEVSEIREKKTDFERKYLADHQISKSWMQNEYRLFIWFLFTFSKLMGIPPQMFGMREWGTVSECFNKQPLFCQYFYLSCKKIKSPEWKQNEDLFIQKLMNTSLTKKWTEIGLELYMKSGGSFFRKPKSIRERWLSHLNPAIKKDDWDWRQDLQLIKSIKETGRKWSKISKIFGNRTEHTIKNRYNQLLTKYLRQDSAKKIGLELQTDQQKLDFIQRQLGKAEAGNFLYSCSSLLEPPMTQAKIEPSEDLQIYSKFFEPIILSQAMDYEERQQN